ncbi:hypothetical protein DY000_02064371 [Brassica cretica]|uniref:Uncharacterized protein n=1 Tax=Brassica cretica TaxID=69181 RepID=A0ABQ7ATJ2_BRACR|nr:hypothetical protein DY000_02064371 [Brassica cretica]
MQVNDAKCCRKYNQTVLKRDESPTNSSEDESPTELRDETSPGGGVSAREGKDERNNDDYKVYIRPI